MSQGREIWIFNHYALPPDQPGGTRHFDISRILVKRGYKVTIFASDFHYSRLTYFRQLKESYEREEIEGVRFVWVSTPAYEKNNWKRIRNMLSYSKKIGSIHQKINGTPDIIIGSSVHLFAVYAAYRIAKKKKTPFIMEVRDLWPKTLVDMGISRWHPLILLFGRLERLLYKHSDKIVTLLPKAIDHIRSFGVDEKKVVCIPNGVELRSTAPPSKPVDEPFRVTYTGAMGQANGLENVLNAAKILQEKQENIEILLVGHGPSKSALLSKAEKEHIHNVIFREPVAKHGVQKILRLSDVLLFNLEDSPVFKYGISSNKLFDYMASGRPVIFSARAGNNPVEKAGAGLTVPPNSPDELADAILELQRMDVDKRNTMGGNGRRYVESHHSMPILADQFEAVFKSLLPS